MTTLLPFDLGGVTEILRLGNWEEGLAEISEVFGASLDPGLVEGPAGLWAGRGTNGEDSINLRLDSFPVLLQFWFMRARGKVIRGKGTPSTEHMLHHGGLDSVPTPFGARMHVAEEERLKALTTNDGRDIWRSSRYRLPVGGMFGETDERLDHTMDGWTGHQEEGGGLIQLMPHDVDMLRGHPRTYTPCCYQEHESIRKRTQREA